MGLTSSPMRERSYKTARSVDLDGSIISDIFWICVRAAAVDT